MGYNSVSWVYTTDVCKELFSEGQFFYSGENKVSIIVMEPIVVQEAPEYAEKCLIISLARGMKVGNKRCIGFCEQCLKAYKISLKKKRD